MLRDDPRFELLEMVEEEAQSTDEPNGGSSASATVLGKRARPNDEQPSTNGSSASQTSSSSSSSSSPLVCFQLVGAALYGLKREQLERTHGIDLSELTKTFVDHLNAQIDASDRGAPKPCLLGSIIVGARADAAADPAGLPRALFAAQFAVGGRCTIAHVWDAITAAADEVLARTFARLNLCPCDHAAADK